MLTTFSLPFTLFVELVCMVCLKRRKNEEQNNGTSSVSVYKIFCKWYNSSLVSFCFVQCCCQLTFFFVDEVMVWFCFDFGLFSLLAWDLKGSRRHYHRFRLVETINKSRILNLELNLQVLNIPKNSKEIFKNFQKMSKVFQFFKIFLKTLKKFQEISRRFEKTSKSFQEEISKNFQKTSGSFQEFPEFFSQKISNTFQKMSKEFPFSVSKNFRKSSKNS